MNMTFGNIFDYKVQLLFSSWDIQTAWQFSIAWIMVFGSVILYHWMKYLLSILEDKIAVALGKRKISSGDSIENDALEPTERTALYGGFNLTHVYSDDTGVCNTLFLLRTLHAILNALTYALALLLMLVAMTYNCLLFLSLVMGYGVGDFLFCAKMFGLRDGNRSNTYDCH
mmetsp:Transcript_21135/g.30285  ORF Transcript_21135/g.30285 Transcript_21135/m.30285 type:complete len:171 (-) Transcript_21135:161-673(-)